MQETCEALSEAVARAARERSEQERETPARRLDAERAAAYSSSSSGAVVVVAGAKSGWNCS